MKYLLTGSSGFLGKVISNALKNDSILTLGRSPNCDVCIDLVNTVPMVNQCDVIIHVAGKAHSVPKTVRENQEFFDVNVIGTKNLLNGLESSLPKSFVYVSSVAVYGLESGTDIQEECLLAASDSYGISKIQAELLVQEWCEKYHVICTILRLPLLAGPNAPGNLGAMIKSIKKGYYLNIGGGIAKRSMVLAEDVGRFIPKVALLGGIYNLTDGYHPSVKELSSLISGQLGKSKPFNIPIWLAVLMAKAGDITGQKIFNSNKLRKITSELTFSDSKARKVPGWNPTPVLKGLRI